MEQLKNVSADFPAIAATTSLSDSSTHPEMQKIDPKHLTTYL